ncbi:MAG TPA: hypothetical protein VFX65_13255, partial [Candidatus Limnocylindrales bacterium]|nr:hypothetical protein [Candidatus Limnocylindrales bacterium]
MLRRLADEADWWRIRDLLIDTFDATPRGWNWDIRRWDGSRFHNAIVTPVETLATTVALAEDSTGRLLGAVH